MATETIVEFNVDDLDRQSIRKSLVNTFLEELPGSKGATTKYIYYVDKLVTGERIILKRPALFNKGFDFTIHIENYKFPISGTSKPKHDDIYEDLCLKEEENPELYTKLEGFITNIYNCDTVDWEEVRNLQFQQGMPVEAILKAIKWLFIEQDITYWNYTGRTKFYNYLMGIE